MNADKLEYTILRSVTQLRQEYYNTYTRQNGSFHVFIQYVHRSSPIVEIPALTRELVRQKLSYGSIPIGTTILFPLWDSGNPPSICRGGESMFNTIFCPTGNSKLVRVKDSSGNIYYGNNSIILNCNLEPIIAVYGRMNIESMDRGEMVLKISKNIYMNKENILEKFILNKVVPFVINHNLFETVEFTDFSGEKSPIRKPVCPEGTQVDSELNRFLDANLEFLLENV